MQFNEAMKHFLLYGKAERQYAHETQIKHRDCFASWLLPAFIGRDVETLTRFDVLALRDAMVRRGLSAARQTSILTTLKVFLGFSITFLKLACLNPSEIKLPRRELPHPEALTPEEVEQMLSCLNPVRFTDVRLRALCELILGTGVRLGEALRMERKPFDRDISEMDIIGKGNKRRTVFFTDRARFWVKAYLQARLDTHPALFITTSDSPRRWARGDVSKFFIRLRMQAKITKHLTPHMLRHTYCTTLLNNGTDIAFIKELAGHEDIQTTARYYLGVDKPALRRIVKERLHYEVGRSFDTKPVTP
jgi:site-specific recombinase XerD